MLVKCHLRTLSLSLPSIFLCVAMQLIFVQVALPGIVDQSFADNGQYSATFPGLYANNVAPVTDSRLFTQPSGRIVSISSLHGSGFPFRINSIGMIGLTPDGVEDTTFGVNGKVIITNTSGYYSNTLAGVAMTADGSMLVWRIVSAVKSTDESYFQKYSADGVLDSSFNGDMPVGARPINASWTPMVTTTEGKVYVLVSISQIGIHLVRLNSDGSRDLTYGINGIVPIRAERSRSSSIIGMHVSENSKMIVGFANGVAMRFNKNGSIDRSYGLQGVATVWSPDERKFNFSSILEGPMNTTMLVGSIGSSADCALFKFNDRGRGDTTFGTNGLATWGVAYRYESARRATIRSDGTITVVGQMNLDTSSTPNLMLSQIDATGQLEKFTGVYFPGIKYLNGTDLLIQSDNKIVVSALVGPITGVPSPGTGLRIVRLSDIRFGEGAISRLFDFDGDGRTDISTYRTDPTNQEQSYWDIYTRTGTLLYTYFGLNGDIPVPSDFDDDGKTDVAVYRPSTRTWYYTTDLNSTVYSSIQFGEEGDIPFANDYDGDRKADFAMYSPGTGTWTIMRSSDGGMDVIQFGQPEDKPFTGDFDGDGKADVTVWRQSNNTFYTLKSTDGSTFSYQIGVEGDEPVSGDFDGDRISDYAVFGTQTGNWWYRKSTNNQIVFFDWGDAGDFPVSGDYNGDGTFDLAVFRPSNATWFGYIANFQTFQIPFGLPDDVPIPGR